MKTNKTVYDVITDRIIEALEQGVVPWRQPWKGCAPSNLVTQKEYRGINTIILSIASFSSPYFATIKQINQLGGAVKKGEKGWPVVFWKFPEHERNGDKAGETAGEGHAGAGKSLSSDRSFPIVRYYTVFNVDQCEGLTGKIPEVIRIPFSPIGECEKLVKGYPDIPVIQHGGNRACYSPSRDTVSIPVPESFASSESYYCTLFHELVHSTGHEKRLGRDGVKGLSAFGDHLYSKEELVAEIGASFLCGTTGLDTDSVFGNQVAYLKSWLDVLKSDKRMVIHSAAQAQKAVDRILGVKSQGSVTDTGMAA